MAPLLKHLPHALITGALAGIMQLIDVKGGGNFCAWAGFAAWACYFLAGGTIMGGVKVTLCWILGMIASVGIIELGTALGSSLGSAAFPIAVFAVATIVILFEKAKLVNTIPFWFIGSAIFFAVNQTQGGDYNKSIKVWLISLLVAMVFGYATVTLRGLYAKKAGA